jgi:acyl-CoA thioester hydrolase
MRIHIPIQVRWSDLDAYGHVNNAAMLTLLEEARVHGFWADNALDDLIDTTVENRPRVFKGGPDSDTFTLIARQEIEYLSPIPHLREPVDVEMWIGKLGGASLDVCYEIYSPVGQEPRELYTRAVTVIVLVDSTTMKPRKMTEAERTELQRFNEPAIEFNRR